MGPEAIARWLRSINQSPQDKTNPRKRSRDALPISPPSSASSASPPSSEAAVAAAADMDYETPQAKRRKQSSRAQDRMAMDIDDTTPTQAPRKSGSRASAASLTPSETSTTGTSTPIRELALRENGPEGFQSKALTANSEEMPLSLKTMLTEMEDIALSIGVIPGWLKPAIEKIKNEDQNFARFRDHMYDSSTPPVGFIAEKDDFRCNTIITNIQDIIASSCDCQDNYQTEAGWNNLVHTSVLKTALYHGMPTRRRLSCVVPCMNATISKGYLARGFGGKMVDYTIAINPTADPDPLVQVAMENRDACLNHTEYEALRNMPVAVNIETKRRGEGQARAELQMGIWLAAQWKFLANRAGVNVRALDFTPALIVIGETWKFGASTYSDGKTTLFTEKILGSTTTGLGVFQVMAAIRVMQKWAEEVYWPWYKEHVLKVHGEADT